MVRCDILPCKRGPICPPITTAGTVYTTKFHGIALTPPAAIKAVTCVNDAEAIVIITINTDVAAATATGIRLRFTNCGIITSPIPTLNKPVRKEPIPVVKTPNTPSLGLSYLYM